MKVLKGLLTASGIVAAIIVAIPVCLGVAAGLVTFYFKVGWNLTK